MQHRGQQTTMQAESEGRTTPPLSRGRHNSKLKVLVRSHAMREEASPPREPSPNHLISPSINVIPSMEPSEASHQHCVSPVPPANPMVVLSPSMSRVSSPCRSPSCISPASTLVPSPGSRCSPMVAATSSSSPQHAGGSATNERHSDPGDCGDYYCDDDDDGDSYDGDGGGGGCYSLSPTNNGTMTTTASTTSPKYLNRLNKQNLEESSRRDAASHLNNKNKKYICDCSAAATSCARCGTKNQDRNNAINNNHTSSVNNNVVGSANTLSVNRAPAKGKLRQQSSSQGSFEGSSSNSPCLSRDSSSEQYTDTTGIDLEVFIAETLNRNFKDQNFMLRIEKDLVNLAKNKEFMFGRKTHYKFPPMSSYQRMLVHRCAAYFGMDHNIESTGKCVVVNKTKNTRIPEVPFKEHIKEDSVFTEEPRRSILKRDSNSIEDYNFKSPDRLFSTENRRSKSYEERAEFYDKTKKRIFNSRDEKLYLLRQIHDTSSNDDFEWAEIPWSSSESDNSSRFRLQLPEANRRQMGKLIKVLSEETGEPLRPCVAKSYSFGGYGGGLNRGDSMASTHSAGPRLLTKQDSAASSISWRLSPSSSGYKSQSQLSESVTPSPTSTPQLITETNRQDSNGSSDGQQEKAQEESHVVWAVTDIQSIPVGSCIIDPKTCSYIKNEDGSLYHYDPNNLPPGFVTASKPPPSPKKSNGNSPQRSYQKERSQSPKKRCLKYSPTHKLSHVTNSSTSPSLPYSPPLPSIQPPNRNFQFVSGLSEGISSVPPQQYHPLYNPGFVAPAAQETVYQQPCIIYTTQYGVPVSSHFEGRMEPPPPMPTDGAYFMNVPDNSGPPSGQIAYQQPASSYWNQQPPLTFYQNTQPSNPTPPQRFPTVPLHQNQTGFVPAASFQPNFLPPSNSVGPPNSDMVSVFSHQPVQMVYSTQPNQTNSVVYPNQPGVVFTQNPMYSNPIYPAQNIPPYPQNPSTPNSCTSSASHPTFAGSVTEPNMVQLTQNMGQMNFIHNPPPNQGFAPNKIGSPHFDCRPKGTSTPKSNKFNTPKPFIIGSSQSSTGTNSPAATVVAGFCPPNSGLYRTPSETPPNHFNYGPNFTVPPMVFRQMSNVRANTPGTSRSSRSPTPASDISHFERQRITLPPTLYHGMPYLIQPDNRIIPGRGQPNAFRPPPPARQQSFQGSDNRSHKSRKSKGNKTSGVPPNKPL